MTRHEVAEDLPVMASPPPPASTTGMSPRSGGSMSRLPAMRRSSLGG
jgi:hypothetical protein